SICPPLTDQPQPAALRPIQMWPGAARPSSPPARLVSPTDTLSRACRSAAGTPAASQKSAACASSGCNWASVRPAVAAPGPLEVASRPAPSVMVRTTALEVIGWPLLKLDAETWAVLDRVTRQVSKFGPSTKSDSVADGLCEERVSARKLVKQALRPRDV